MICDVRTVQGAEFTWGLYGFCLRSEQGYRCCKVDLDYDECMDFNACGGFLPPGLTPVIVCHYFILGRGRAEALCPLDLESSA